MMIKFDVYYYIKINNFQYMGWGKLVKPFVFVPSNAYDNFKAAVLDKYAADETNTIIKDVQVCSQN